MKTEPHHAKVGYFEPTGGFQQSVLDWSRVNLESFPWRDSSRTPFEVLIAELLLKRTTAKAAASVYQDFLDRFPTIESVAAASVKSLATAFSRVGLQQQRARSAQGPSPPLD